jgi:phosphatidylglycerophosphate synthase
MINSTRVSWKWFWTAQALSIGRVACTFLFVVIVPFAERSWLAAVVYALAVITDMLDGRAARLGNAASTFGGAMDLFGDRYLTIISCMYAGFRGVNFIALAIIILRELLSAIMRIVQVDGEFVLGINATIGKLVLTLIWGGTFILILHPEGLDRIFGVPYYVVAFFYLFYLPHRIYKGFPNIIRSIKSDLMET